MQFPITYESIINYLQIGLDILIMWILLNYLIKMVRNSRRTIQIFQGVILILLIKLLSSLLGLKTLNWLADNIVSWGFLAIIIVFQPEIRSILEKIGNNNTFLRIATLSSGEKEKLVDELMEATTSLAFSKTGALITLEQSISLQDYAATGVKMNSLVSAELLCSIFMTTTPLHDGAVIIQGDKLACASAYFPPTNQDLPSKYGARHRAAIGISETTDSITIVVSEETGRVSVAQNGKLIQMNKTKLREFLDRIILNKEKVQGKENEKANEEFVPNENKEKIKNFNTAAFTVSELLNENADPIVKDIVKETIDNNVIDEKIIVRTIPVPKDTISKTGGNK